MLVLSLFLISTAATVPLTEEENSSLQVTCGNRKLSTRARRSMNTPEATRREGPWSVALKYASYLGDNMDLFNSSEVVCTGTLISSRHVLTAAHCFQQVEESDCSNSKILEAGYDFFETETNLHNYLVVAPEVCLGENCITEFTKPKPRGMRIKKITLSREYILGKCYNAHFNQWQGDVAVLELEKDVEFSDFVQPACLSTELLEPRTDLTMFGFGTSMQVAAEHNQTVKTPTGVLRKLETSTKDICTLKAANHENLICSSDVKSLACGGDSGSGQITFRKDGKADVSGILVAGTYCWVAFDRFKRGEDIDAEDLNVIVSRHNWWICQATGNCPGNSRDQAVFERVKLESALKELKLLGHPDTELAYRRPVDTVYDLMP